MPREAGVNGQEDVARQAPDRGDAPAKRVGDARVGGIARESEPGSGDGVQAVGIDDLETARAFARAPGPGRAARRVTRRQVRGDRQLAHAQRLTVGHHLHPRDRRKARGLPAEPVLRIVGGWFSALDGAGAGRAGGHDGAAGPLQRRDPARVIEVRVRVDDQPDVLGSEPQLADVRVDQRRRLRQTAVEQDQPLVGGDQHRAEAGHPDVVGVPEDTKRRLRQRSRRRTTRRLWAHRLSTPLARRRLPPARARQ